MKKRTKIVATVGPQRMENENNRTDELGAFVDGSIPHGQLLEKFIEAGVDIIRLNMSFASRQTSYGQNEQEYLTWLKEHKDTTADKVAVLGDLPGPKIRLGNVCLGEYDSLKYRDRFFLGFGKMRPPEPGASVLVNDLPFNQAITKVNGEESFSAYAKKLERPVFLSIGDGEVELEAAVFLDDDIVRCEFLSGLAKAEDISSGKGLTIKHAALDIPAFQKADKDTLDFLLRNGSDLLAYVAVSFAQNKDDILEVKHFIETHTVIKKQLREQYRINDSTTARVISPGIIAKIETAKAWDNINEILDVADGVMVARGDLGVQMLAEEVPEIQKELIRLCNARGKVVITATQMLDSMENKSVPTRAEAADVFNAILDGTDAVMLSGETSTGRHPIKSIQTMIRIAESAEKYYFMPDHRRLFEHIVSESDSLVEIVTKRLCDEESKARETSRRPPVNAKPYYSWLADLYGEKATRSKKQRITDRICEAACRFSEAPEHARAKTRNTDFNTTEWKAKPIVVPTTSGRTVFMIARFRPAGCIIGAAHYERTYRKLLLSFGVQPVRIGVTQTNSQQVVDDSIKRAIDGKLLNEGVEIVATLGTPLYIPGTTNMIQILLVKDLESD